MSMVIGMEVRANVAGGSRSSTRVGKEVQPLPSVGMDVSCSYTKEKQQLRKLQNGGFFKWY